MKQQTTVDVGFKAETVAIGYLRLHGYRVLQRNARSKYSEIDIICWKDYCLYFVEVRYRQDAEQAIASITHQKMQRMIRGAKLWCEMQLQSTDITQQTRQLLATAKQEISFIAVTGNPMQVAYFEPHLL